MIHLKSFLDVCRRKMSANFIILSAPEMLFTADSACDQGGTRGVTSNVSVRAGHGAQMAGVLYAVQPAIFNPDPDPRTIYSLGNQRGDTR